MTSRSQKQTQWVQHSISWKPGEKVETVIRAIRLYEARDIAGLEAWKRQMQTEGIKDFHALRIVTKYIQKYYEE